MGGRKQHYIPRLVLRGFAAGKTKKGVSQVWWFPRGKDAVCTAVDNVFAQRDFYGEPGSGLDEQLTEMEGRLGQFVNHARNVTEPEEVLPNTNAVELCHTMCMRSRWIRQVLERVGLGALNLVSDQIAEPTGMLDLLNDQTAREPNWLRKSFAQEATRQVGRRLSDQEISVIIDVADQVSSNWERVVPLLDTDSLQDIFSVFGAQLPQIAKDGHIMGVKKSLPGNSLREFFESLNWRIELYPEGSLILGDCGPLLLNESGKILGPMGVPGRDEVVAAMFPISHCHLLVGGHGELDEIESIVRETAAWSLEAFVSSADSPACYAAQSLIGSNVDRWFRELELRH